MRHATTRSVRASLEWKLPPSAGPYTLVGTSRAADATAWVIPELGWCVDAGEVTKNLRPHQIFMTHTHSDHVHAIHRMRSFLTKPPIYAPTSTLPYLERCMVSFQELTLNGPVDPEIWGTRYTLVGVEPGEEIEIAVGKKTYIVRTLETQHSVPSVGYAIYERRDKLKPELLGLPSDEIRALREAGETITAPVDLGIIAFLGDTNESVLERHPEVLEVPVVVMDCSFLAPEHLENATRTMHGHWERIEPWVAANPETTFILSHISWRYDDDAIRAAFSDCPHENIVIWADLESGLEHTMRGG